MPTADFKSAAARPANSLLDLTRLKQRWGIHVPEWEVACDLVLADVVECAKQR
ncbi:MAG: hypothetical protein U5L03_00435 [Burkholderiaceae bacterium]|nr:hypothetical protein [Burkholderiaceae bacterium]